MRIDVHTHFVYLEFTKHLQGRDALPRAVLEGGTYVVQCAPAMRLPATSNIVDMDVKLRDLELLQVDLSVLSVGVPGPDVLGGDEADDWAARINDYLAGIIAAYPGKFLGFGSIGFGSVERSIAEVDRCIRELDVKGIQLFSNVNHRPLDSPEILPVLQHVASLGVPLNMHPGIPLNLTAIDHPSLVAPLGFLYDTTLNTMRLIHSGLFDQAPDLKLIVPHVGGVIPYLQGRIATHQAQRLPLGDRPPMAHPTQHYLDKLYVDTVCYHPEALEYCYRLLGAERLLYGTDHPFAAFDLAAGMVERLDCSEAERELIYHGNAERLLRLQ